MRRAVFWLGLIGVVAAASSAPAGYGGIWKTGDDAVVLWISEHDTRAMTVLRTMDAVHFEAFLDNDFSDGFSASEMSGQGSILSISFTGDTTATSVYTASGGAPVTAAFTKRFGGAYCGFVFAAGGIFSDPNGLAYRVTASSPYGSVRYKDAGGSDLLTNSDSVVRAFGNHVFLIGRFTSDVVTVVDPVFTQANPIAQYSVGVEDPMGAIDLPSPQSSSNPQDIEFVSESVAYMSFLGASAVLKLNPLTGERLGLIDMSVFNEGDDGLPEVGQMAKVGVFLYAAMSRLDRNTGWKPLTGMVAKIDTTSDTLVDTNPAAEGTQAISLTHRDPQDMEYLESTGELFVACSGDYGDDAYNAGIDIIDTVTDTVTDTVDKVDVGYSPALLKICDGGKAYLVGPDDSGDWPWPYVVSEVNPTARTITHYRFLELPTFISDIAVGCKSQGCTLFVVDRSDADPGILIFDTGTNSLVGKAATELPMQSIAVLDR